MVEYWIFGGILDILWNISVFVQLAVAAASMWTKREMVEFKDAIRKEGGDAIIKVSVGPIPIPLGFTFIWVFPK